MPVSFAINVRLNLEIQSKTMYHDHISPLSINTSRDVGPSGNAKTNGRCRSYQKKQFFYHRQGLFLTRDEVSQFEAKQLAFQAARIPYKLKCREQ